MCKIKFDKYLIRSDGRVEILCPHGVGHPSEILTKEIGIFWEQWMSVHGCCECHDTAEFWAFEKKLLAKFKAEKDQAK